MLHENWYEHKANNNKKDVLMPCSAEIENLPSTDNQDDGKIVFPFPAAKRLVIMWRCRELRRVFFLSFLFWGNLATFPTNDEQKTATSNTLGRFSFEIVFKKQVTKSIILITRNEMIFAETFFVTKRWEKANKFWIIFATRMENGLTDRNWDKECEGERS